MAEHTRRRLHDGGAMDELLASRIEEAKGPVTGKSLPDDVRSDFEARSGFSARGVRVVESDLPQAVHANAVTQGSTIHFPRGGYAPETAEGRRVLLHELGHTAQQARGEVRAERAGLVNDSPALESAADAAFSQPAFGAQTGAFAAAGAAPAPLPAAPAGAPMQMDGEAFDQAMLDEFGLTEEEYEKSLSWWQRRKRNKEKAQAAKKKSKAEMQQQVDALEKPLTATYALVARERRSKAPPMPQGKGLTGWWRRRQWEKEREKESLQDEQIKEDFLVQQLGAGKSEDELKQLRKDVRKARRHNAKKALKKAYRNSNFAGRMHDADGTVYDEQERLRLSLLSAGPEDTAPIEGASSNYTATSYVGYAGLGGNVLGSVGMPVMGLGYSMEDGERVANEMVQNIVGDGYFDFSTSAAGTGLTGAFGGVAALGNALTAGANIHRSHDSDKAGDRGTAAQKGLEAGAAILSTGAAVAKAFGKANVPGVAAANVLGMASGAVTVAAGSVGVHHARKTEKAMRGQLADEKYKEGYNAQDAEALEEYEMMRMAKAAAYNRKIASGFDIATGMVDAASGMAGLFGPAGTMVGTALTGVSVAGKVAKFATGKAMEANSRDKALREVIYSDEIQSIEDQVTAAGLLTREERETQLAKASGTTGREGLHNKMIVRQAIRLHERIRAGESGDSTLEQDAFVRTMLEGMGFTDPAKYGKITVQQLAEKLGFTGANWREAMQDPKEEKRQKKQAEKQARNDEVRKMMRKAAAQKEKKEAKRRGKTLEKLKKQKTIKSAVGGGVDPEQVAKKAREVQLRRGQTAGG